MSIYSDKEMIGDIISFSINFFLSFLGQIFFAIILFYLCSIFIIFLILSKILKLLAKIFLFIIPMPSKWRFAFQEKIVELKNRLLSIDLVITGLGVILVLFIFIGFGFRSLVKTELPDFKNWMAKKAEIIDVDKDRIGDLVIIDLNSEDGISGKLIFEFKANKTIFIWQKRNKINIALKKSNSKKWIINNKKFLKEFSEKFNQNLNFD